MTDTIRLYGRIFLSFEIKAVTGLHIGSSSEGMEIGGVDNPVMRDSLTKIPFIPGSSLRGKIRSLLEKKFEAKQNNRIGQSYIHSCEEILEFEKCPICHLFGVTGKIQKKTEHVITISRLIVRDVKMSDKSKQQLENANLDSLFTEVKTEVAIDRVTSAASPRNIERVPAGTVFGPAEMVFTLYGKEDLALFKHVIEGLQLLEDDYLGGSGSRGSGKVQFTDITLTTRGGVDYTKENPVGNYKSVQELANAYTEMKFADLFKG